MASFKAGNSNFPVQQSQIKLSDHDFSNVDKALKLEWIVANGLGGYASSTVVGVNTRKYHGLLVASFNPPVDRRVMLSKVDERLQVDGETLVFGANEYDDGVHPAEPRCLTGFSRFPHPTYRYARGKLQLYKTILVTHGKNAVTIFYEVRAPEKEAVLQILPLVNFRHFHATTEKAKVHWKISQETSQKKTAVINEKPESTLVMSSTMGKYVAYEDKWVERIHFRADRTLGTSYVDDCLIPGCFLLELKPGDTTQFQIVAAAEKKVKQAQTVHSALCRQLEHPQVPFEKEENRCSDLAAEFQLHHPNLARANWLDWLVKAADSFVVNRSSTNTKTVIAGYHWFEDWGRDSLISLPGLTLVTGRFEDAKQVLLTFEHYCKNGVMPNRFPDQAGEEPAYNTVDATLWFFNAVLQYLKYTGDFRFVKEKLWTTLKNVVDLHVQGTINDIGLDSDGLIKHGPQLTWMDAVANNRAVTPRDGKAVEIQALWYNALKTMELLSAHFKQDGAAAEYRRMAETARESFAEKFWNARENCLFDVVKGSFKDARLRPNQILAVSQTFSMLNETKQTAIVSVAHEKLWSQNGLKTLSADHPEYRGKYGGSQVERDRAYHNGTAWPWLVGPFVTAFLKVKGFEAEWRTYAFKNFLEPFFKEQTLQSGLGTLSEVFDGDPPHSAGGCISQAWSVAEPLRAYVEDVTFQRPPFEKTVLKGFKPTKLKGTIHGV